MSLSPDAPSYAIGVDLGGTKIEAVLLEVEPMTGNQHPDALQASVGKDPASRVRARVRVPTDAGRGYDAIVQTLVDCVRGLKAQVPLAAGQSWQTQAPDAGPLVSVGVGLPGHISRRTGQVKNSNTACLNGRDLWGDFRRAMGQPVAFDNDANCLTLAEATWGAAQGAETVFGIILGTGVGGGIAHAGRVLSGLQGIAGEWGHNVLPGEPLLPGRPCYCGKNGCVETWLSGPGFQRTLLELAGWQGSAKDFNLHLEALIARGEPLPAAEEAALTAYLARFGRAVSGIINVLDPDVVVIGGGMSRLLPLYSRGVDEVRRNVFNDELLTRIVPAILGDAAGVYGAALIGLRGP